MPALVGDEIDIIISDLPVERMDLTFTLRIKCMEYYPSCPFNVSLKLQMAIIVGQKVVSR